MLFSFYCEIYFCQDVFFFHVINMQSLSYRIYQYVIIVNGCFMEYVTHFWMKMFFDSKLAYFIPSLAKIWMFMLLPSHRVIENYMASHTFLSSDHEL